MGKKSTCVWKTATGIHCICSESSKQGKRWNACSLLCWFLFFILLHSMESRRQWTGNVWFCPVILLKVQTYSSVQGTMARLGPLVLFFSCAVVRKNTQEKEASRDTSLSLLRRHFACFGKQVIIPLL